MIEWSGDRFCLKVHHYLSRKWGPNLKIKRCKHKEMGPYNTNITCYYCGRLYKSSIGRLSQERNSPAKMTFGRTPRHLTSAYFRPVSLGKYLLAIYSLILWQCWTEQENRLVHPARSLVFPIECRYLSFFFQWRLVTPMRYFFSSYPFSSLSLQFSSCDNIIIIIFKR